MTSPPEGTSNSASLGSQLRMSTNSLAPSISPQPELQQPGMASQIIGRTPSGQLPTAYWDRKMQSDMSRSGDTRTQLFVGNLPFRVRWQDLKDLFRRSGTVLRADVALTPENRSKGFGTVLFAHDVDAYRAIEMFNGFNWQSRVLDVRLDHQDPTGAIALSMAAQTQPLGVPLPGAANWQHYQQPMMPSLGMPPPPGHLSSFQGLTPQGLPPHMQSTMSQAPSRPTSAASNRPATGTRSRAVSPQPQNVSPMVFANPAPEEQQHRMSSPDPQPFSHQPDLSQPQQSFMPMFMLPPGSVAYPNMGYYVPQTQNRASPIPPQAFAGRHLFVGNLPFNCQWQDLKDLFRQAGNILRADVTLGPEGRSRGFGTVLYASQDDAQRAVEMFNGFEFRGRQLKVHFDKYAQQANDAANGVMSGIPGDEDGILSTMPQPSSLASIAGLGRPSRAFTPPIGVSVASQRSIAADRPASRNFTAPQPVSTNSASVFPNTINGERRASFSTTSDSRSARQTPEPQTHPHDRPSSLYINTSAPYAGSARTETVSDTSRPASQNQSQPSHRQGPGPLHFSQQERYSTGPAALMSPPVPGMGTPGFHPFSPQTGRIAMTPSMPGFSFMPFPQTPPIIPSFLSPGIGPFSPPLGGGAFNSQMSSYMNPAPGAPIHFQAATPQTPSLDHVMSNGYFAADPQRQSEGLSEDQFRKSANAPESANSADSGRPKSSGNTESSYFPPVETLIERPVSTGPEGLRSPAMLEVNTPGGGIDNDNGQMRHEGMSKVERSGLGVTLDRLASLDINTDESAISLDETLDADRLAPGSTANARRASHDESSIPGSRNSLDERRPVKTEGNARRASFDNDAARRKDRADFGKSIWS